MKKPPEQSRDWVTVARLLRTRGRHGELSAEPLSSHPERFEDLDEVRLQGAEGFRTRMFRVSDIWPHKDRLIFKFEGVDSISDAEALRGAEVQIPLAERFELPEGEYYHSDLVGCRVVDREAGEVGLVQEFQELGGNGILRVSADGGREVLIPFNRSICSKIDVAAKVIEIEAPDGLLELNAP